jgi:hypothetical protein
METTQTKTQGVREKLGFRRTTVLGSAFLNCNKDFPTIFVQPTSDEITTEVSKRTGAEYTYIPVINLETGEEVKLSLTGQLRYHLEKFQNDGKTLIGEKLEISWQGTAEVKFADEIRTVNQYQVYLLA